VLTLITIYYYTLVCVNLDPNPQQNDSNSAMSDCKSFWFSIETKDDDSIKLGNLNINMINYLL